MPVKVVHWNPRQRLKVLPIGRGLPVLGRVNNFGDLLGPLLVQKIVSDRHLEEKSSSQRLVSIGSIIQMTRPGDVVWGSGVNIKSHTPILNTKLDVRAVRGPLSRVSLQDCGVEVPEVFGDPAVLWPRFWSREFYEENYPGTPRDLSIVPNLYDFSRYRDKSDVVINPQGNPHEVIAKISRSEFVVASSLHGIAIAEAYGIPARLVIPGVEPLFKYEDYYRGTGRGSFRAARSVTEALDLGGEPPIDSDLDALLDAFPEDLWSRAPLTPAAPKL
jgi:pyruvyltransferase